MNHSQGKLLIIKCKNPTCNNTFQIHKSIIDRKLYCCRKCRSEHHWIVKPLFENPCFNPSCKNIIRKKYLQKIETVKYCCAGCRKQHKQIIKEIWKNEEIKSNCRVCKTLLITKRELCGKLIPRKICNDCNKKENRLKTSKMTDKWIFLYKNDESFRNKMKNIHLENPEKMKLWRSNPDNLRKWYLGCQNAFKNGQSNLENVVNEHLKSKFPISEIKRHEPISNMLVDFYIPNKNLVVECHGDYWHMNPNKYQPTDFNKSTKRTAQEHWEKDKKRKLFMESQGYKVVELWESEINNGDYKKLDIYTS